MATRTDTAGNESDDGIDLDLDLVVERGHRRADTAGNEYDDGIDPSRESTVPTRPLLPTQLGQPAQPLYAPLGRTGTPHVCPVCGGRGRVPTGFYDSTSGYYTTVTTAPESCRSCAGTGVIWAG